MMLLKENGIATRPGTQALHMLNYYKEKYNLDENDFPVAKSCFECSMAIPMHNEMKKEDYDHVISILRTI
jgi:perosamine synthetase